MSPVTEAPPAPGSTRQDEKTQDSHDPGDGAAPPMPPADLGREPDPQPDDEAVPGLFMLGDYEIDKPVKKGPRKPDGNTLKIKMTKVDLGQSKFARGTRIVLASVVQVTSEGTQDSIDTQSGDVKSSAMEEKATTCAAMRLEEYLASKLIDDELLAKVCFEADLPLPQRLQDGSAE